MAEAELEQAGRGATSSLPIVPRFPVSWIVERPSIERGFVRAVWFVIPLEYYLLTTFSNGFEVSDFSAATAVSLIYLLVLFALSSCLAGAWTRRKGDFDPLLRIWSITLIVTWSASLTLLALFTYVSVHLKYLTPFLGMDYDVVTHLVCEVFASCLRTPPALTWQTFVIYAVYTSAALASIVYASRRFNQEGQTSVALGGYQEPNLIFVCLINAAIMTVFNTWTNSGIAFGIRTVLTPLLNCP
jgi:hypothetical protein